MPGVGGSGEEGVEGNEGGVVAAVAHGANDKLAVGGVGAPREDECELTQRCKYLWQFEKTVGGKVLCVGVAVGERNGGSHGGELMGVAEAVAVGVDEVELVLGVG